MLRLVSKRWVQIVLLLALLAGSVGLRLQDPDLVKRWRQLTFDAYNKKTDNNMRSASPTESWNR
jgi:hypothetical protein